MSSTNLGMGEGKPSDSATKNMVRGDIGRHISKHISEKCFLLLVVIQFICNTKRQEVENKWFISLMTSFYKNKKDVPLKKFPPPKIFQTMIHIIKIYQWHYLNFIYIFIYL